MFAATIREGEVVRLPSGRLGVVEGYFAGAAFGFYTDDGDKWQLAPKLLKFVSSKWSGPTVLSAPVAIAALIEESENGPV